jgi:hypothetical protein
MDERSKAGCEETAGRPFPESLCHRCAAPPRYVTSDRGSVFIHCPVLQRYPPQPVLACDAFIEQGSG